MKKITVIILSFLMTAFHGMQAMQENPYLAWEFIKNVENESKLAHITTLKNLHELNLICDDFPEDDGIPSYIKTLIEMKRYQDLQNFLDAIVFPYIPRDLAKTACITLIEHVEDMDKDKAFKLWQDVEHACTLKLLLLEIWKFENQLACPNHTMDDLYRFRLFYFKILDDQRYVEHLVDCGALNLNQDKIRELRLLRTMVEFENDCNIMCPQLKMLAPVECLRLVSAKLQRIPAWIECIESLEKIYAVETVEIPEALRNHPRIKIYSHAELLLNKYL